MSASVDEQISGAVPETSSGLILTERTPWRISMQLTDVVGGRTVQLSAIINRKAMYLQSASLTPSAPEAWIKVPLQQHGQAALLHDVQNENPMSQVGLLQAGDHLHLVGHETVDGVLTSKYKGYFSAAAGLAAIPSWQRTEFAAVASQITGNIHFVLWIEPGNQVKKIRMTETVSGSKVTITYTINWINRPLHITIPHATATVSLPAGADGSVS